MAQISPTISMPEELLEQIDDNRHAATPRSVWVREAIAMRLESEGVVPVTEGDN